MSTVHFCLLVVNMGGQLVISFVFVAALMMRRGPSLWTFALVMSLLSSLSLITIFYNWAHWASLVKRWSHPPTQVCTCAHMCTLIPKHTHTHPEAHVLNTHTHLGVPIFMPIRRGTHYISLTHTHTHARLRYKWYWVCFFLSLCPFHFPSSTAPFNAVTSLRRVNRGWWSDARAKAAPEERCLLFCSSRASCTASSGQNPETLLSPLH